MYISKDQSPNFIKTIDAFLAPKKSIVNLKHKTIVVRHLEFKKRGYITSHDVRKNIITICLSSILSKHV